MRRILLWFCAVYLLFAVGLNALILPVWAGSDPSLSAVAVTIGFAAGFTIVAITVALARHIKREASR